jgi:hypothetical protein
MRHAVVSSVLLFGLAACQSSRPLSPTGIYKTAQAFRQQRPSLPGTNAGRVFLARKLYVVAPAGSGKARAKIALDSVWGYAGANHEAYRVYRRRAYRVEQADTLAMYSQVVSNGKSQQTIYFFSQGLNGPVERLSKKRLKQAYAAYPHFLELLGSVKWYQSLAAYEVPAAGTRSFRLVSLYRQAIGLPATYSH